MQGCVARRGCRTLHKVSHTSGHTEYRVAHMHPANTATPAFLSKQVDFLSLTESHVFKFIGVSYTQCHAPVHKGVVA